MPVTTRDKVVEQIARSKEPKKEILKLLGDLQGMHPREDLVIVGIFFRPEMTPGGIIKPIDSIREDQYQGKVGVVVKMGPAAIGGKPIVVEGDWAVFDVKDGWSFYYNDVPCRAVPYDRIRLIVDNPESVL